MFIKPASKPSNKAYALCDAVADAPAGSVGKATVYVSHAWKYKIMDVLEQLIALGERELDA